MLNVQSPPAIWYSAKFPNILLLAHHLTVQTLAVLAQLCIYPSQETEITMCPGCGDEHFYLYLEILSRVVDGGGI